MKNTLNTSGISYAQIDLLCIRLLAHKDKKKISIKEYLKKFPPLTLLFHLLNIMASHLCQNPMTIIHLLYHHLYHPLTHPNKPFTH